MIFSLGFHHLSALGDLLLDLEIGGFLLFFDFLNLLCLT